MLRTLITKRNACLLVTALVLLAALATIWPLRLYKEDHVFQGRGQIQKISEPVTEENDAGEYFTAQYAHLQELAVYIDSYEEGNGLKFQLFDTTNGVNTLKAEEHLQVDTGTLPGYVTIPVDVDLTPGETYVYLVRGEGSVFHVGLESEEVSADATAPVYELGFYHDTSINGLATATRLTYRMPIDKLASLRLGLVYLGAALAVALLFVLYYRLRPAADHLTTLERVLQYCGTPVVLVYGAFFLYCIWTERFDERLSDNLVYSLGVVLTMGVLLFGLWHDRTGMPDMINGEILRKHWRHYAISICLAVILACSVSYMNAVRDVTHTVMERWIVLLLCLMALLMGGGRGREENRKVGHAKISRRLFLPLLVLAVLMLLFRHGKTWVLLFVLVYCLVFVRFLFWRERRYWLEDLCRGIALHFAFAVADSLLHRYYFAFLYSRFPMEFHTVTVTGYYLLIVGAAALTLFTRKFLLVHADGQPHPFRWYAGRLWKEALFLGMTGSYMLMTLSRAGIFELALFYVLAAVLCGHGRRAAFPARKEAVPSEEDKAAAVSSRDDEATVDASGESRAADAADREKKRPAGKLRGRLFGWMVLATVAALPAVFTNQRLVSTAVGQPRWYEEVEPYPDAVVRNVRWDSKWFMSAEIFVRDFADRVIGGGIGTKVYFRYHWDVQQDVNATDLDQYVIGLAEEEPEPVWLRPVVILAMNDESLAGADAAVGSLDAGDYSNGRLAVWKAYLEELNATGHAVMGVTLPDGRTTTHAHNNILQTAYDYGVPAGVVLAVLELLTIVSAGIYYYRSGGKRDSYALFLLFVVLGYLITGLVEWTFTLCNPYCLIWMLCLAVLLFPEDSQDAVRS